MFRLRDCLIFLAGAATFYILGSLLALASGALPTNIFFGTEITSQLFITGIVITTLVVIILLWWASRLPK
ncbi:MAG: hypothetical protein AB7F19_04695 [Candidatus Babeliales bacterium]